MKRELDRFNAVLRRRWFVVFSVCLIGLAALPLVATVIPAYTAKAEILIVSEALKDPTLSDPNLPAIISSTEVMSRVIRRLHLRIDPVALGKKVKTKVPGKSSILDISYKDTDGDRAASVVNAVADEAVVYYHDIATRGYTDVIAALKRQISETEAVVTSSDEQLGRASSQDSTAGSDNALSDLTTQFDTLRTSRFQAAATLAADAAMAERLNSQLSRLEPIARGEILQKDPVYQAVDTQYGKDMADLVQQRASFKDSFPGLKALADRTSRESQQLKGVATTAVAEGDGLSSTYTQALVDEMKANSAVDADRARLNELDSEVAAEQRHLQNVAGNGATVSTLRARRDAATAQFLALGQRLSAAQGDAAQAASLGTLVVVSRAIPGPSTLWLWLGAIFALTVAFAIAAAYLVDAINPRFWGIREIEMAYRRPVFAEVGS